MKSVFWASAVTAFVSICFEVLLPVLPARAQTTSTVANLFLSNGAELDFNLYGANGGASDKIVVQNQFNFSSASAGNYIIGFSLGDSANLTAGSTFTLVTFGGTNFTPADASDFVAAPRNGFSSINGTFTLTNPDSANGLPGALQFHLTSYTAMPEPGSLWLIVLYVPLMGAARFRGVFHSSTRSLAKP